MPVPLGAERLVFGSERLGLGSEPVPLGSEPVRLRLEPIAVDTDILEVPAQRFDGLDFVSAAGDLRLRFPKFRPEALGLSLCGGEFLPQGPGPIGLLLQCPGLIAEPVPLGADRLVFFAEALQLLLEPIAVGAKGLNLSLARFGDLACLGLDFLECGPKPIGFRPSSLQLPSQGDKLGHLLPERPGLVADLVEFGADLCRCEALRLGLRCCSRACPDGSRKSCTRS